MNQIRISDQNVNKKKNKFYKWLKRIAFFLLLWLFFLEFNHLSLAIEALQQINNDQVNLINNLTHKVSNLQTSNIDIQSQIEVLKIKINGLQIDHLHNSIPQVVHNEIHSTHTDSPVIHNSKSVLPSIPIVTTAAMAVLTLLKGISSFVPSF